MALYNSPNYTVAQPKKTRQGKSQNTKLSATFSEWCKEEIQRSGQVTQIFGTNYDIKRIADSLERIADLLEEKNGVVSERKHRGTLNELSSVTE